MEWKNLHFVWKQFLSSGNLPNVIYSNSLKQIFKEEYEYNENTQVLIIDNVSKTQDIFKIPTEELEHINSLNPIARGTYINDLYNMVNNKNL